LIRTRHQAKTRNEKKIRAELGKILKNELEEPAEGDKVVKGRGSSAFFTKASHFLLEQYTKIDGLGSEQV
jgi:hypothetical protein